MTQRPRSRTCKSCLRPLDPDYDRIESLLANGLPPAPDSRSTKAELRKALQEHRALLADLRITLLQVYAREISIRADHIH